MRHARRPSVSSRHPSVSKSKLAGETQARKRWSAQLAAADACSAGRWMQKPSIGCRTSQVTANAPAPASPTIAQVLLPLVAVEDSPDNRPTEGSRSAGHTVPSVFVHRTGRGWCDRRTPRRCLPCSTTATITPTTSPTPRQAGSAPLDHGASGGRRSSAPGGVATRGVTRRARLRRRSLLPGDLRHRRATSPLDARHLLGQVKHQPLILSAHDRQGPLHGNVTARRVKFHLDFTGADAHRRLQRQLSHHPPVDRDVGPTRDRRSPRCARGGSGSHPRASSRIARFLTTQASPVACSASPT